MCRMTWQLLLPCVSFLVIHCWRPLVLLLWMLFVQRDMRWKTILTVCSQTYVSKPYSFCSCSKSTALHLNLRTIFSGTDFFMRIYRYHSPNTIKWVVIFRIFLSFLDISKIELWGFDVKPSKCLSIIISVWFLLLIIYCGYIIFELLNFNLL